jgi:F5/8 type C domain
VIRAKLHRVRADIREFFLLEEAQRRNAKFTESQRRSIRAHYDAAMRRVSAAKDLRGPDQTHAAVSLYRAAGLCFTYAFLVARDERVDVGALAPEAAVQGLDRAFEIDRVEAPANFDSAKAIVASSDPLAFDSLTGDLVGRKAEELEASTRWLSTIVDPRSRRQLKLTGAVRVGAAVVGILGALVWLAMRLFSPPNLALNKAVRGSSSDWGTAPAGAADGLKNGRFGFHSREEQSPWWSVDLGRAYHVRTVKVFGRGDCCYEQSIPLALEVSDDGTTYRKIAERTEPFSESDPWVMTAPDSLVTRFIRLRTERPSVLVLSEVEVYGERRK